MPKITNEKLIEIILAQDKLLKLKAEKSKDNGVDKLIAGLNEEIKSLGGEVKKAKKEKDESNSILELLTKTGKKGEGKEKEKEKEKSPFLTELNDILKGEDK